MTGPSSSLLSPSNVKCLGVLGYFFFVVVVAAFTTTLIVELLVAVLVDSLVDSFVDLLVGLLVGLIVLVTHCFLFLSRMMVSDSVLLHAIEASKSFNACGSLAPRRT